MSEENVEIVRRGLDAWNRRDIDDLLADTDPGIETSTPRRQSSRERGGCAEVSAVWRAQWEILLDARFKVDRFFDRGDEIVVLGRLSRRMPGSDARIDDRFLGSWKLRDGKVIRVEALGFGRAEVQTALEAAGLRE